MVPQLWVVEEAAEDGVRHVLDLDGTLEQNELLGWLTLDRDSTLPATEVFDGTDVDRDIDDRKAFTEAGWPKMAFIEHAFSGDPTNWWAPNHAAVEAMLRSSGMRITGKPAHEIYLCEPDHDRVAWPQGRGRAELLSATGRDWGL